MHQILALPAQLPSSRTRLVGARNGKAISMKTKHQQPTKGPPGSGPFPWTPSSVPVWEHAVTTSSLAHGFGDVTSNEAGFFHGINEVRRGLQHGVVGHEVCGSDTRAVVKDVNC